MIAKEQIIKEIEWRYDHSKTMEDQFKKKWEEDVTDEDIYVQYMMWHATRVSFENLLRAIK